MSTSDNDTSSTDDNICEKMLSTVNETFSNWLLKELDKKGWSQAELAREANVSRTAISNVLSQQRQPGPDLCLAIARGLKLPPELVFRKAGILPELLADNVRDKEIDYLFSQLTPEEQEELIELARFKIERRDRKKQNR